MNGLFEKLANATKPEKQVSNILTAKLRRGEIVLAKQGAYGLNAVSYTNDKQANAKQIQLSLLGVNCSVYVPFGSCVRYIKIND